MRVVGAIATGHDLPIVETQRVPRPTIRLRVVAAGLPTDVKDNRAESFRLAVSSEGIEITGGGPAGVFYATQGLLQLLPTDIFSTGAVRHRIDLGDSRYCASRG